MNKDYNKAITAEDLIRRYDLNNLNSFKKKIVEAKKELEKLDKTTYQFAESVLKSIKELQDQVDGNITTWFFNGVPLLDNFPANEWKTINEKNSHLGDLYYNNDTGYAYRFAQENEEYKWLKITDSDVVEALAIANAAQDTADKKRQVFVTTPVPPYEVGDMWIKEDKEIFRCRAKRTAGEYSSVDWVVATDYTNDDYAKNVEAVLNQFQETVTKDYATKVLLETTKDSINASVESITTEIKENIIGVEDELSIIESKTNENSTKIDNNYQQLINELDGKATVENITTVTNRLDEINTSTEKTIQVLEDIQVNGVSQVKTTTGYTFNSEGLKIEKLNSPTGGIFDDAGVEIIDKIGSVAKTLFYSGYVNNEMAEKVSVLLKYLGQTVTYSNSLIFLKYLSSQNMRIEDCEDAIFGKGMAFFYIGGDE